MIDKIINVILIGLIFGGIFRLAKWYDPDLPMWVLGFMMACLAVNLQATRKQSGLDS